jgi:hypothetical protein
MAKRSLKSEIAERGLENLETQIAELDEIDEQLDKHRHKIINKGKESIKIFSKPFYIIGIALYTLGSSKEEELGLLTISFGSFLILFGIVKAAVRLAVLKLIFRK